MRSDQHSSMRLLAKAEARNWRPSPLRLRPTMRIAERCLRWLK